MTYYSSIVCKPQREQPRRLVASVKPMCTFDKVLNQRVDWVAWAIVQIYGTRGAIDDACTTYSGTRHVAEYCMIYRDHAPRTIIARIARASVLASFPASPSSARTIY